ncbi:hypothetical protein [Actinoplanes aureus]|uniref:Uncharacterized protein n=1 Tax=Actinoplanes aureus TaxID=2792083 RepID=A0A931FZ39_9ACTN|nr:hypothetical protein [Actinoplanes aureus]MBG0560099.1 hypothetical protein [Actinoplanes aureus]
MTRDDPFSGSGIARRLFRMDRELESVVRDAQCRDWVADRPDRVGFARLGQVRHEVFTAARRYRVAVPRVDVAELLLMTVVAVAVPVVLARWSEHPLFLAAAFVAGGWAALAGRAGWRRLRRFRARTARVGPAAIDDPYLYAGLRRRIEACAVAARADGSHRRRVAATDLEYALDWLAAAQDELPRGA